MSFFSRSFCISLSRQAVLLRFTFITSSVLLSSDWLIHLLSLLTFDKFVSRSCRFTSMESHSTNPFFSQASSQNDVTAARSERGRASGGSVRIEERRPRANPIKRRLNSANKMKFAIPLHCAFRSKKMQYLVLSPTNRGRFRRALSYCPLVSQCLDLYLSKVRLLSCRGGSATTINHARHKIKPISQVGVARRQLTYPAAMLVQPLCADTLLIPD